MFKWLFTLTLFVTLPLHIALANTSNMNIVAPKSWYLEVDSQLAADVKRVFRIDLPEGIYFSDQRYAWHRSEVKANGLIDAESFESDSLGKGAAYIGVILGESSTQDDELWLIKPNKEKFLVATGDSFRGQWTYTKLIGPSEHWEPVRGGFMYLDQGRGVHIFDHESGTQKSFSAAKVQIKNLNGTVDQPFLRLDFINNHLFYVNDAGELHTINLETLDSKLMLKGLAWPFHIQRTGVFFLKNNELKHRWLRYNNASGYSLSAEEFVYEFRKDVNGDPVDEFIAEWDSFYILRASPSGRKIRYNIDSNLQLTRVLGERSKFRASGKQDDLMMESVEHVELVNALNRGGKSPVYGLNGVNRFLSDALGGEKNTWAMLRYEKGQLAEELVSSFIWDQQTQAVPVSSHLRKLDRVWEVDAAIVFDIKDDDLILEYFRTLHDVVRGRQSILFLKNFPTLLETEAQGMSSVLRTFWKTFELCIKAGECRVVMTMREPVFKAMNKSNFDIFEEAHQYIVPKLDKDDRLTVTRYGLSQLERRKNRRVTDEAFDFLIKFAMNLGRQKESPGNELDLLRNLFTFMDTYHPDQMVIDRTMGRAWIDHIRGIGPLRDSIDVEGLRAFLKRKMVGHDEAIDAVCDGLRPAVSGTHFSPKPLAFYTLVGTPGVGKTYMAKLVAEYLTGKDSMLLVDMSTFNGIPKDSPLYQELAASKNQVRVVLFDDVDQVGKKQLDLLAGIVEEGRYAQGSSRELSFSNTIVFWTSNWGEKLLRDRTTTTQSFRQALRRDLTEPQGDRKPIMRKRIWSRIESTLYPLYPFTERQLFELALVYSRDHIEQLNEVSGIQLKIDPKLLVRVISYEAEAQAGARSIINQIDGKILNHYRAVTHLRGVEKIVLLQLNNTTEVFTNLDSDFRDAWDEVETITDDNLDEFLRKYGSGFKDN